MTNTNYYYIIRIMKRVLSKFSDIKQILPGLIALGAMAVFVFIFFTQEEIAKEEFPARLTGSLKEEVEKPRDERESIGEEDLLRGQKLLEIKDDDHVLGSPDAPYTLVFFSSFECLSSVKIFQEIILKHVESGRLKVVWRHLPETENGKLLSAGSECAREQGKFWEYVDLSFQGGISSRNLFEKAASLDLNHEKFQSCVDSGKYNKKIEEELRAARFIDVFKTPEFFINGERMPITTIKGIISP